MGRERTILERLRRGEPPSSRTAVEDTNALIRSIQANVARVLNAREGHAPAQPEYGVPAPSEIVYGFPESIGALQQRIKALLERYEPRLGDVEVLHLERERHELALHYQVQARLKTSSTTSWVTYMLRMEPSGRIAVNR